MTQEELSRRKKLGRQHNGANCFSGKIFCGCCGEMYGSKVWHSNDKYRRVIWQCNAKFKNHEPCATPHLTEQNIDEVIRMVGLNPEDKKPVGKYSLGMRQRLGIAQAIMEKPEILILDEPFNGLDKQGVADIHALLQTEKNMGRCIILASHSAADIAQACDVVYEMQDGQLRLKPSHAC